MDTRNLDEMFIEFMSNRNILTTVMSNTFIKSTKIDEVFSRIECDPDTGRKILHALTFMAPGHQYHPLFKRGLWDGKVSLFDPKTGKIYTGLVPELQTTAGKVDHFSDDSIISKHDEPKSRGLIPGISNNFDHRTVASGFTERQYQTDTIRHCMRQGRALIVSPTSSGKSVMIYRLIQEYNRKTLVIVDSLNLLKQMKSDFKDYGCDVEKHVHMICSGADKQTEKQIVISTWQSLLKLPKSWFEQFELVIGDECHRFKASSLRRIMENMTKCPLRFGFTGTLDNTQVHKFILIGLFGQVKQIKTTKELMDEGYVAPLEIKALVLKYDKHVRELMSGTSYQAEIEFLYDHSKRNSFIINLALALKGNTLIIFQRVDKHGVPLFEMLEKEANGRPVYFVSGKTNADTREHIRKIINTHQDSITIASAGVFSTGVNIPALSNIIISSPTKSVIRTLQTIGRGIRLHPNKTKCVLYDIADDLRIDKHVNYTIRHFTERIRLYTAEDFNYTIIPVPFGETK